MASQTVVIDEALHNELRGIWQPQEKGRISRIIERLREKFQIEQHFGWERMLLYGRVKDNKMVEQFIGYLTAIAPGLVILDTTADDFLLPFSGLLERVEPKYVQLFGLRPFSAPHMSAWLYIWPSDSAAGQGRFKDCPVWVSFGWELSNLGIDPARWTIMEPWLDQWLPKQE